MKSKATFVIVLIVIMAMVSLCEGTCKWYGTTPYCEGTCPSGYYRSAATQCSGYSPGCWTGSKVCCCT
ncbi:unnamed protein product [Rotaria sordida]|uniref:Uncharacterized protein n=1 Tax=Rotaria sordida TaxID=392033 RepID=A0A813ULA6_9BILA|nr:unnamed protein product [Rotaria sordida]